MRYYKIVISNAKTGQVWVPSSLQGANLGGASYTSMVNGQTLPGALDIELDLFTYNFGAAVGNGSLTIWGVSLQEIQQSSNLNGFNIAIYGGMAPGLPLATAQAPYAGLLVKGNIYPAWGNWIGTDQYLSMNILPGYANNGAPLFGTNEQPAAISWNWQQGTSMAQALRATLQAAFPGVTVNINISPNLVLTNQNQDPGVYGSLAQFANYINQRSIATLNTANYGGVNIAYDSTQNTINVSDGTVSSSAPPKQLQFRDFIGQPTWLGVGINFKTPMRADLKVGQSIILPQGLNPITTPSSSILQQSSKLAFQGIYQIMRTRAVGRYREASADAWVTVVDATQLNKAAQN